jgi:flagellar biosynthesis protein FlhB
MAENKDGQEKTELATTKRLKDAADKGQVSKSQDVTTSALLLFGGMTVFIFGVPLIQNYLSFMSLTFINSTGFVFTDQNVVHGFYTIVALLAKVLLPIVLVILFIAYAGEIAQVGFQVASKKFTEGLRWKQIFNPFSGMKRIFFSKHALIELLKSLVKILLLGFIVWSVLSGKGDEIVGLLERPYMDIAVFMASLSFELVLKMGIAYIFIAVADFYYQKWKFKEDMKMTKQETKEESKQMEGNPMIKARMRQIMNTKMRKIIMSNVRRADVVITNPTHFAVALQYTSGEMSAPKVVAKGVDFLAKRIRDIATENDIPIIEDPPLARNIFFNVDIDEEIPENLFKAVAQILAYVFSLKQEKQVF